MSLLVDPSRSRDRNSVRNRSDKRVRSLQEAKPKDTYYREEYGWIMSDADVVKEKEVKGEYDRAIATTQANIDKARSDMNKAIASGKGDINGAYDQGISGIQSGSMDLVNVRVVNGNNIEQSYQVPRSYASEFSGAEGMSTAWFGDNTMNVDVHAVGGRVVGKEVHTALGNASNQVQAHQADNARAYDASVNNANAERGAQLAGYDAANAKSVSAAESQWGSALETAKAAYGKRVAAGKQQYETSKQNYNDSVMGMDEGLLESRTGQVNPNAGSNKR